MKKILITKKRETIYKTESGKSWSKKGIEIEYSIMSKKHYETYTSDDTLKFHSNFAGGTSRASRGYEYIGYVVNKITSISPDRQIKHIDTFYFINIDEEDLINKMGYREKEIYNNLEYFNTSYTNGQQYITFYSSDSSFMIEKNSQRIVN